MRHLSKRDKKTQKLTTIAHHTAFDYEQTNTALSDKKDLDSMTNEKQFKREI